MRTLPITVTAADGVPLAVRQWLPDRGDTPKGIVQIVHGMAEHSQRYADFASHLVEAGYAVYANDHRGHGASAASVEEAGHFADHDGWVKAVQDLTLVTQLARADFPGVPAVLFGHSMGSILARAYAIRFGADIDGLVLSAVGGDPGVLAKVLLLVAKAEGRIRGGRARSTLLDTVTFGRYNNAFKPNRTKFDWLSRDEEQVDKYIADPWCGYISTTTFFADLSRVVSFVNNRDNIARVPTTLPIYLFSGALDPVGDNTKGVRAVVEQYRRAGVTDVTYHFYPEARHETLNETNRLEVFADVERWLDTHIAVQR